WALVARAVRRRDPTTQPYRPGDPLARCRRGFAKARFALVRRIAQHAPDRRALPTATSFASGDCLFVQPAGNGTNAETLSAVQLEYPTHNPRLLFVNLIVRGRMICPADKTISER